MPPLRFRRAIRYVARRRRRFDDVADMLDASCYARLMPATLDTSVDMPVRYVTVINDCHNATPPRHEWHQAPCR